MLLGNRQFVFFKAWRDPIGDDEEPFMPMLSETELIDSSEKGYNPDVQSTSYLPMQTSTEIHNEFSFIFPNPTADFAYISSEKNGVLSVSIYDMTGLEVMKLNQYKSMEVINLSELANGIYFVRIIGTLETFTIIKTQ